MSWYFFAENKQNFEQKKKEAKKLFLGIQKQQLLLCFEEEKENLGIKFFSLAAFLFNGVGNSFLVLE